MELPIWLKHTSGHKQVCWLDHNRSKVFMKLLSLCLNLISKSNTLKHKGKKELDMNYIFTCNRFFSEMISLGNNSEIYGTTG